MEHKVPLSIVVKSFALHGFDSVKQYRSRKVDTMRAQDNNELTVYIASKFKIQPEALLCYPLSSRRFHGIAVSTHNLLFLSVIPSFHTIPPTPLQVDFYLINLL